MKDGRGGPGGVQDGPAVRGARQSVESPLVSPVELWPTLEAKSHGSKARTACLPWVARELNLHFRGYSAKTTAIIHLLLKAGIIEK